MTERNREELAEIYAAFLNTKSWRVHRDLKEVVEEIWPELLHKVKSPLSEMH